VIASEAQACAMSGKNVNEKPIARIFIIEYTLKASVPHFKIKEVPTVIVPVQTSGSKKLGATRVAK
jgi:hypothetical protein